MKTYGGMEVQFHAFLTSTLDRVEWPASRSSRLVAVKITQCVCWIRGWVGLLDDLGACPSWNRTGSSVRRNGLLYGPKLNPANKVWCRFYRFASSRCSICWQTDIKTRLSYYMFGLYISHYECVKKYSGFKEVYDVFSYKTEYEATSCFSKEKLRKNFFLTKLNVI